MNVKGKKCAAQISLDKFVCTCAVKKHLLGKRGGCGGVNSLFLVIFVFMSLPLLLISVYNVILRHPVCLLILKFFCVILPKPTVSMWTQTFLRVLRRPVCLLILSLRGNVFREYAEKRFLLKVVYNDAL